MSKDHSGQDNGKIKWDLEKKASRENDEAFVQAKAAVKKLWDTFKTRVKGAVGATPEVIEAMLVDFQRGAHQVLVKIPTDRTKAFQEFTRTLVLEAQVKLGLLDKPSVEVAEKLMKENAFTQQLSDGRQGDTYGFATTEAMLAIPVVQNCNSPDLVGFAMHGSVLCAVYEGKERPAIHPIGTVKYPNKIHLPRLKQLAKEFKKKGLTFPDYKLLPKGPKALLPRIPENL